MATEDSLKQSMDKAVKRYSSLFRLPSDQKVILLLATLCVASGLLSTTVLFPSMKGVVEGLLLGPALFLATFVADYVVNILFLRKGTIYNLRRIMALSLFCWALWFFFIAIGAIVGARFDYQWWVRLCLLGFSAVMILRLTVLSSTSSISQKRNLLASLLQPFCCVMPFLMLWAETGRPITLLMFVFLPFSLVISLGSAFIFLSSLNRLGKQTLGLSSLSLFKAFMLNWVLDLNAPFEEILEELGERRDVEAGIVQFGSAKPKTVMIVPSVHPGPFKNIGSSLLPSLLKADVEKALDCVVCVPHGLLGHEFDLASQSQNQKVISAVLESMKGFEASEAKASPFVKVSNGLATASCQVFGKSAIISFTLAPRTIEDLPQELGLFAREEAEKLGLCLCAVVNAHNSIDGLTEIQGSLASLKEVAKECLKKATLLKQLPFEVGAATIIPKEFTLEDGMGSGGITVLVVKVSEKRIAYVVIDGNNMVTGLREDILSSMRSLGIDDGEIFTTDTHSVSALVLGGHGYHPVGEVMNKGRLISHIEEATKAALARLEPVKASCRTIIVPGVKVLGAKQLETLCLLIDKSLQKAKKIVVPVFATAGLLLMLFLLFT